MHLAHFLFKVIKIDWIFSMRCVHNIHWKFVEFFNSVFIKGWLLIFSPYKSIYFTSKTKMLKKKYELCRSKIIYSFIPFCTTMLRFSFTLLYQRNFWNSLPKVRLDLFIWTDQSFELCCKFLTLIVL